MSHKNGKIPHYVKKTTLSVRPLKRAKTMKAKEKSKKVIK